MKFTQFSLVAVMLSLSLSAFAKHDGKDWTMAPECLAPVAACKAAGFKVGAHVKGHKEGEDNGLWVDCIGVVADGKKLIAGVETTAAQACKKAKQAAKH